MPMTGGWWRTLAHGRGVAVLVVALDLDSNLGAILDRVLLDYGTRHGDSVAVLTGRRNFRLTLPEC